TSTYDFSSYAPKVWQDEVKKAGVDPNGVLFTLLVGGNGMPIAWLRSFVMTDTVLCLDAATGKTLWKKDFPEDPENYLRHYDDQTGGGGALGCCSTPAIW